MRALQESSDEALELLQEGAGAAPSPPKPKFTPSSPEIKHGSPEWMHEINAHRIREMKAHPEMGGGRPRKPSKAEAEEIYLLRLVPRALKVLKGQLNSNDERVAAAAARDILDRVKGKAAQTIKQTGSQTHTIRYETAAWTFGTNGGDDTDED